MGIKKSAVSLTDAITKLEKATDSKVAIIIVDETETDKDMSKDRSTCHTNQAKILKIAALKKISVMLVNFGHVGKLGFCETFTSGLSKTLDASIPKDTMQYSKSPMETDGFKNTQLVKDIENYTDVIIMGQSTNACCAATARGAAELGKTIHTSKGVVRGGGVTALSLFFFRADNTDYGWPDGTILHATV